MPLDYTGDDTATQAPSPAWSKGVNPIVRLPVDGETLNVASIYQPHKLMADLGDLVADKLFWLEVANSITGGNTFAEAQAFTGLSGDTNPAMEFTGTATTRKYAQKFVLDGTMQARIYQDKSAVGLTLTVNALWNGSQWARDSAAHSLRVIFAGGTIKISYYPSGSASPWNDGSWETATELKSSVGDLANTVGGFSATTYLGAGTAKSGTTTPTPTVGVGDLWKDGVPLAWGRCTNNGAALSLVRGYNVSATSRTALGKGRVTLVTAATNHLIPVVVQLDSGTPLHMFVDSTSLTTSVFEVWSKNKDDSAFVDSDFTFVCFGG